MRILTIKRFGLFTMAFAVTLVVAGCEESLTDSTDNLVPDIPEEGAPFVEFVSTEDPTGAAGATVELTIEPGEAIGEPIEVEYQATGPALGSVSPSSPVTIPFDASSSTLDEATINVTLAQNAAPPDTVRVELTGATAAESGQDILVGRGGTNVDKSRTITVTQ